jgi:hypothetical protein
MLPAIRFTIDVAARETIPFAIPVADSVFTPQGSGAFDHYDTFVSSRRDD